MFSVLNSCSHQQVASAEMTKSDWDCKITDNSPHVCHAKCHRLLSVFVPLFSSVNIVETFLIIPCFKFLLTAFMFNAKCQMILVCDIESLAQ